MHKYKPTVLIFQTHQACIQYPTVDTTVVYCTYTAYSMLDVPCIQRVVVTSCCLTHCCLPMVSNQCGHFSLTPDIYKIFAP